jgi:peptidoglycan/LPS O-acetylase OafA/YrhL
VANGYLGVELFFVLSGFILSHVYLQSFGEGRFHYGKFLWARIARVYPLHIAVLAGLGALAIAATVAGMTLGTGLVNWAALPANLLMLHAWGLAPAAAWNHPSWSISAEWFAYLCFPAFAWAAWRLRHRPNMAVIGVLILLFGLYTVFEALAGFELTQATYKWGALRIVPCFAYGTAIHLLWRSGAMQNRIQAKFWSAAFAVLILALAQIDAPDAAIVTAFGGLILALAGLTSTGSKVLSGKVGVYLGEISYSVYMVCFPWRSWVTRTRSCRPPCGCCCSSASCHWRPRPTIWSSGPPAPCCAAGPTGVFRSAPGMSLVRHDDVRRLRRPCFE